MYCSLNFLAGSDVWWCVCLSPWMASQLQYQRHHVERFSAQLKTSSVAGTFSDSMNYQTVNVLVSASQGFSLDSRSSANFQAEIQSRRSRYQLFLLMVVSVDQNAVQPGTCWLLRKKLLFSKEKWILFMQLLCYHWYYYFLHVNLNTS